MEFYKNEISKYPNSDINCNIGLKWYCTIILKIIILMIDIQTGPIKHLPIKNSVEQICRKYQFPIQHIASVLKFQHLPALISTVDGSFIKALYYKTWMDKTYFEKSCFQVLPDLLKKRPNYELIHSVLYSELIGSLQKKTKAWKQ